MATKKFDWQPVGGVQNIDVETENVVVGQVVFDLGSTLKGTPLRKSSANVRVRIDNNSEIDEEVGVAVVVFDAEGNVVAAGSNGTQVGLPEQGRPHVLRHRLSRTCTAASTTPRTSSSRSRPGPRAAKSSKPTQRAPAPEPTPVP